MGEKKNTCNQMALKRKLGRAIPSTPEYQSLTTTKSNEQ